MKTWMLFIFVFVFQALPQEVTAPPVEIFFGTENMGTNDPIPIISFIAKSYVWAVEFPIPSNCNNFNFVLNDSFNTGSYTPIANNQLENSWGGFDFVMSRNAGAQIFGYGLYKFSVSNGKYFYLDYRDERIGCDNYGTVGHNIDVWIKYDKNTNQLQYKHGVGTIYVSIPNGTYLSLWEMKNAGTQQTDDFDSYWSHSLATIPSSASNGHPYLIWGPYPDAGTLNGNITEYRIYKSQAHLPGYEPSNFTYFDSVEPDEYSYIDYSEDVGNGDNAKSYFITALVEDHSEGSGETGPTNIVEVELAPPSKAIAGNLIELGFSYQLLQNYPNPFNPSTIIYYSLGQDDYINLKVFNTLGEEIKTIVNGYRSAGSYSVDVNFSELPNGVYIYRMETSNFNATRKMVLLK